MKAPSSSHTKFPLPQFRVSRIIITGLGFFAVACSENLTAPDGSSAVAQRTSRMPTPDIIVMERTTTDAAGNGEMPRVRSSREVLKAQTRLAGQGIDVRAAAPPEPVALQGLPLPPVSLPARRELAICNLLPTWTERSAGATGRDVRLTGVGDAPASSIKVVQDDGTTWSIERSWTRTTSSWQLDKQVTTGAHGYRDVVTYRHETPNGRMVNNAIATTSCPGQLHLAGMPSSGLSQSLYAPHAGALNAILFPMSGVNKEELGCGGGGTSDCYDKQMAVYRDDIALIIAATAVVTTCSPPAVLTAIPCITATTAYLAAVGYLKIDQLALERCLRDAATPKLPVSSVTPGVVSGTGSLGTTVTALGNVSIVGATGTTLGDCIQPSGHCHYETWEISYDGGQTWSLLGSLLVCDNAA